MALLTADDVLNKKFQPTKFREGYDQDEVDDFLDEVVATLRVVTGENEELKAKLEAAEARIAELSSSASGQDPVGAAAPMPAPAEPESTQVMEQTEEQAPAPQPESPAEPAGPAAPQASAPVEEPESATGMLQLAQRLHDEYVENGKAEAERLVTEARSESERLVSEAHSESERLVSEAEEQRTRTLNQLEGERSLLERKIDELRVFERDYRTRLKSYLEGLLSDVEGRGGGLSGYGSGRSENDQRRF